MNRRPITLIGTIIALLFAVMSPASTTYAASITVTTPVDELNSDGDCSLREAIRAANLNQRVDACAVGSGTDTIQLPAGTYILARPGTAEDVGETGDLDITSNLSLVGAGRTATVIDGNRLDRVVDIGASVTVQLSGITIRNGSTRATENLASEGTGGGILNRGTLTLTSSGVSTNIAEVGDAYDEDEQMYLSLASTGGGIYNWGTMTLRDSSITNNQSTQGGGVLNRGILTFINTVVSGNKASDVAAIGGTLYSGDGGGIYNSINATAVITDTTISDNGATIDSYGEAGAQGGGLFNWGTLALNNSTIDNNSSIGYSERGDGGGVFNNDTGSMELTNTTISHNVASGSGGGLHSYGLTTRLQNVTIIDNIADSDNDGTGDGGGIFSDSQVTISFREIVKRSV